MELVTQPCWSLNDQEEILVRMGVGGVTKVGNLPLDFVPADSGDKVVFRIPELQDRQVDVGFFDYNDTLTNTAPINVAANTWVKFTNNGLGSYTNKLYKSTVLTDVWNTSTNQFNWTGLKLGDTVDIRLEFTITTTSPNQTMNISIFNGVGTASEYSIGFMPEVQYKNVASRVVNTFTSIYMGDLNTLNNPSEIRIKSDAICTVKVAGWYVRTILVGQH